MFVVHCQHPTSKGWEEREGAMYHAAKRRWDSASSGGGTRELWWYCKTLAEAVIVSDELRKIGGVTVFDPRETIDGV